MADVNTPVTPNEEPVGATTFPVAPQQPVRAATVPIASAISMPSVEAEGAGVAKEFTRPVATRWETTKAAVSEWMPVNVYNYLNAPKFTPEPGFSTVDRLHNETIQFSEDEEKFMASGSNSEYDWRLGQVQKHRENVKKMGDNAATAFVVGGLDLGYMALDLLSAGAGRVARLGTLGRMAVGGAIGTAGAYGAGVVEQQTLPIGDKEILLNAMINGAASGIFVGPGGKVSRGATTADAALNDVVHDVANTVTTSVPNSRWVPALDADGVPRVHANGKPVLTKVEDGTASMDTPVAAAQIPKIIDESNNAVGTLRQTVQKADQALADLKQSLDGAQVPSQTLNVDRVRTGAKGKLGTVRGALDEIINKVGGEPSMKVFAQNFLERLGAMADDIPVIKRDNIKRSYYHRGEHAVYLRGNANDPIAIHEVAHALTAHKVGYGKANPKTAHGQIVKELDSIRKLASADLKKAGAGYYAQNVDELVAGVYEGRQDLLKALSAIPDPGTGGRKSVLHSVVDAMRRLLGLGSNDMNAYLRVLNLSQELMDLPLATTVKGQQGSRLLHYAPNTSTTVPNTVPNTVINAQLDDLWSQRIANKLSWSLHKSLSKFNKDVGDTLVSNPLDARNVSAADYQRSIRADLSAAQYKVEAILQDEMAKAGAGTFMRAFRPAKSMEVQRGIERRLGRELEQRELQAVDGVFTKPGGYVETPYTRMADAWQDMMDAGLKEMQRSGVDGADAIATSAGYFSRRWNSASLADAEQRLLAQNGGDLKAARSALTDLVRDAMMRKNAWDKTTAGYVASAILDRARRKGEFSDAEFRGHIGNNNLVELRDSLRSAGVPEDRMQKIMDLMAGVTDEANRSSYMKSRIDLDPSTAMSLPDGTSVTIHDLISTDMSNIAERYLDDVAGKSALARVGLKTESDISKFRTNAVNGIPDTADKKTFVDLYNNTIDAIMGRPVGSDMTASLRVMQAATQMTGLASSGVWQMTEYAKIMQHHGVLATIGYGLKEFPSLFRLADVDPAYAGDLVGILTRNSAQDIRLRPFLNKLEDGYELTGNAVIEHGLQQSKQWIPYINGMRFVHHHQARISANLITDSVIRGAKGDTRALRALEKYGIDAQLMDSVRADLVNHGGDTLKWSDGTWDTLRNPLNRMMDDDVLRSRTGELPAFAQFSQLGKFIFTFRSFVLSAHNKILMGTLNRDGLMGVSLILAYQYPAALMAVQANQVMQGKDMLEGDKWARAAIAQMGGIGLFSEVAGVITGDKKNFGTPGLIAADNIYKLAAAASTGNLGNVTAAAVRATPILSILPGARAATEMLK